MDTIKEYEDMGFIGCDVNLETSLYEYGLIWGTNEHCIKGEKMFVYCVHEDEEANDQQFGFAYMSVKDIKNTLKEDCFEYDKFASYCDIEPLKDILNSYSDNEFFSLVKCMIDYYGYENIIGSCYNTFNIYTEHN